MELLLIFWALIWAIICSLIGARKGAAFGYFFLGAILGPIGAVIALVGKGNRVKCPFCRKLIDPRASVCAFCQRETKFDPQSPLISLPLFYKQLICGVLILLIFWFICSCRCSL